MQTITFNITVNITDTTISLDRAIAHLRIQAIGKVFTNVIVSVLGGTIKSDNTFNIIDTSGVLLEVYRLESHTLTLTLKSDIDYPLFYENSVSNVAIISEGVTYLNELKAYPLLNKYSALYNYYNNVGSLYDDLSYTSPFNTLKFKYTPSSKLSCRLQTSYDGSVNMIFTDNVGKTKLINSRFIVMDDGTAKLADRYSVKDTNTYSDQFSYRTNLIPSYSGIPKLSFLGLTSNGKLAPGANRYYFRYVTANGAESDIMEESRLVEIHEGTNPTDSVGTKDSEFVHKSVHFTLTNLDRSFYGIRMYYTHLSGEVGVIPTAHRIMAIYSIDNDGTCSIVHTGYEQITDIDTDILNISYSNIGSGKSIELTDDRLLIANTESSISYDITDAKLATKLVISEGVFTTSQSAYIVGALDDNYANPVVSYNKTGYWPGETAELGIVFITDDGTTPVYPLSGLDNLTGIAEYDRDKLGITGKNIDPVNGQNQLGAYRTKDDSNNNLYSVSNDIITFNNTKLRVNILPLLGFNTNSITSLEITEHEYLLLLENKISQYTYMYDFYGKTSSLITVGDILTLKNAPTADYDISVEYKDSSTGKAITAKFHVDSVASTVTLSTLKETISAVAVTSIPADTFLYAKIVPKTVDVSKYNGFFIVRRKRKPDILAQGISTPVATIPITTNTIADKAVASSGNFIGVGTTTDAAKGGTTKVPVPLCMMPFGSEVIPTGQTYTINDSVTGTPLTIKRKAHTDFILRAPVYDRKEIKSVAFYSPDIDTDTIYASTYLNDNNITTKFCASRVLIDAHSTPKQPFLNSSMLDYVKISGIAADSTVFTNDSSSKFVEENTLHGGTTGFSGKADRTLYTYFSASIKDTVNPLALISDTADTIFRNSDSTKAPTAVGVKPQATENGKVVTTDSDMEEDKTPGMSVKYGRYLGINLSSYYPTLDSLYLIENDPINNSNVQLSLKTKLNATNLDFTSVNTLGIVTKLYDGGSTGPLSTEHWVSRYSYDEDSPYVAVTSRIDLSNDTISSILDVFGGDCYAGMMWKQVWSPLGINGLPNATDISAYLSQREALGLLDYGIAIPVPARSNRNFYVRTPERADIMEWKALGIDRTYLPIIKNIRGNKLNETKKYNFGISDNSYSSNKLFRLNSRFPFILNNYPNRVYASAQASSTEFVNGLAVFTGLDFRDYNFELGNIVSMLRNNGVVFIAFTEGLAILNVNEKAAITSNGRVMLDSAVILPKKLHVVSDTVGVQYEHSMVATDSSIFGVDANRKVIWRAAPNKYQTIVLNEISTAKVKHTVTTLVSDMEAAYNSISSSKTPWKDIVATYDEIKKDIYFTFVVKYIDNGVKVAYSKALVYNKLLNLWITKTDDDRIYYHTVGKDRLLFSAREGNKLLKYPNNKNFNESVYYNKFGSTAYDSSLEFVAKPNAPGKTMFTNIQLNGKSPIPNTVSYVTDSRDSEIQVIIPSTYVTYKHATAKFIPNIIGDAANLLRVNNAAISKWDGSILSPGDLIQIEYPDKTYKNLVVKELDYSSNILYVDKDVTPVTTEITLRIGFKENEFISNAIVNTDSVKFVCKYVNSVNMVENQPVGSYLKCKMQFTGTSQIKIKSIFTYNTSIVS